MKTCHVFEHLGKPPYKFIGFDELVWVNPVTGACKAGGSCDHCGTGIRNAFFFESADGRRFKVGSSCVTKSGDRGMRKFVAEETRKAKLAKEQAALPELREKVRALVEELQPKTSKLGHPNYYFSSQGKTLHDYFQFVSKHLSFSKAKRLLRELTKIKES